MKIIILNYSLLDKMLVDLHIHLKYRSRCSNLTARDLKNNLSPQIEALCICDHDLIKPKKFNPFKKIHAFYGAELTTNYGHILVYGVKAIPLRKKDPEYVIDYIHDRGGVAVCAHPFTNRHDGFGKHVFDYDFDALEINGALEKNFHEMAREAANSMGLPLIGGSDAHSARQLNTVATKFNQTITSMADIVYCIKKKKCRVEYLQ